MDTGLLVAARLGLDPLVPAAPSEDAGDLPPPSTPAPSAAWIEGALAVIAGHQRAGRAAGSTTRRKAPKRVAPSTIAASSRSTGMASKAARSWKMAKGTDVDA